MASIEMGSEQLFLRKVYLRIIALRVGAFFYQFGMVLCQQLFSLGKIKS